MKKYVVGYTTGTFDLFHVGHLNLLEHAKEQCERLVVGVSTDALVKSYKGRFPLIPFEDRVRIVAALRCVDEVIPQESMDKLAVYDKIRFDVLFHGDDWKGTSLYNKIEAELNHKGIDCVYFPYTERISSDVIRTWLEREKPL